jgi:hypothetical protein
MATFVVRVWLPDRPGALGAVASRIGAVRGDLVGIDILERGGGRAIDELIVDLPSRELLSLLIDEMGQVDGVDVEDVRPATDGQPDPRVDALETAAMLVEKTTLDGLLDALCERAYHDFEADWSAVIDSVTVTDAPLASVGHPPSTAWLAAFVAGGSSSVTVAAGETGPEDVAWATLPSAGLAVVLGRRGRPLRARERQQLAALTRIADHRHGEVAGRTVFGANTTA